MDSLLAVAMLAALLPAFWLPDAQYRRARRHGYRAPGAVAVVLASVTTALCVVVALLWNTDKADGLRFATTLSITATASWWMAGRLLLAVLPRRSGRVFGERQIAFPFALVGWIVTGVGAGLGAIGVWLWFTARQTSLAATRTAWLAFFLIVVGRYVVKRGRGIASELPPGQAPADHPRSPVLYLRAFNQESQAFAAGDASKYGAFVEGWQKVAIPGQRVEIPFEQYFHRSIEKRLGSFVALGSPEDYVPPHGAVRHYATDDTWQRELAQLARSARCIVAEVGSSGNLSWEFEHLRSKRLQRKLFLFTPPEDAVAPWRSSVGRFFGRLRGLVVPVDWKTFSSELGSLGYELSPEDPGPGSLLTFDSKGRQVLLTTEADLPDDYMEPLDDWLSRKEKTGRCVPVNCSTCERSFCVRPEHVEWAVLRCRRCRSPRRSLRRAAAGVLAALGGVFGFLAYGGSLDSFVGGYPLVGDHPRLAATVILGVLFVVVMYVNPLEGDPP